MKYKLWVEHKEGKPYHFIASEDKTEILKKLALWDCDDKTTLLLKTETSVSEEIYQLLD